MDISELICCHIFVLGRSVSAFNVLCTCVSFDTHTITERSIPISSTLNIKTITKTPVHKHWLPHLHSQCCLTLSSFFFRLAFFNILLPSVLMFNGITNKETLKKMEA